MAGCAALALAAATARRAPLRTRWRPLAASGNRAGGAAPASSGSPRSIGPSDPTMICASACCPDSCCADGGALEAGTWPRSARPRVRPARRSPAPPSPPYVLETARGTDYRPITGTKPQRNSRPGRRTTHPPSRLRLAVHSAVNLACLRLPGESGRSVRKSRA
jgi:hypothetical protein